MSFTTAIGQSWTKNWKRAAQAVLTCVVMSAATAVGLAVFGSDILAAWKTPGKAEQALSSSASFEELLSFETPAGTVVRFAAETKEAENSIRRASNSLLLVKDWTFTQATTSRFAQNSYYANSRLALFSYYANSRLAQNSFNFAASRLAQNSFNSAASRLAQNSYAIYNVAITIEHLQSAVDFYLTNLQNYLNSVAQVYPIVNGLAVIVGNVRNFLDTTVTNYVDALRTLQEAFNLQIPAILRPPPIPPASPTS